MIARVACCALRRNHQHHDIRIHLRPFTFVNPGIAVNVSTKVNRRGRHAKTIRTPPRHCLVAAYKSESLSLTPPTRYCRRSTMWTTFTSDRNPKYTHPKGLPKVAHLALVARRLWTFLPRVECTKDPGELFWAIMARPNQPLFPLRRVRENTAKPKASSYDTACWVYSSMQFLCDKKHSNVRSCCRTKNMTPVNAVLEF